MHIAPYLKAIYSLIAVTLLLNLLIAIYRYATKKLICMPFNVKFEVNIPRILLKQNIFFEMKYKFKENFKNHENKRKTYR